MVKHREGKEYTNADGTTTKPVEHRAGWDATFSAPKSVSLTALVGGDERVKEAHRAAVTTALEELEKYTHARIGGNNPAEKTGKFIAAKFEHDTARPVNGYAAPQLHTHAIIFNVTEREDGSTRAIQERTFFESQNYATAVYQSALTYPAPQAGLRDRDRARAARPKSRATPRSTLTRPAPVPSRSKSRWSETGHRDRRRRRSPRTAPATGSRRSRPRRSICAQGDGAQSSATSPNGSSPQPANGPMSKRREPDCSQSRQGAVAFARSRVFEREAVADERVIMREALRRGMGEVSFAEIQAEFDSGDERRRVPCRRRRQTRYRSQLHDAGDDRHERANVRHVIDGRNALEPMMAPRPPSAGRNPRVSERSAARVIQEVLTSPTACMDSRGLQAPVKRGRLAAIREGAEQGGYKVEGFAPTSKAAGQLREAGIEANTLQSFLARSRRPDPASRASLHAGRVEPCQHQADAGIPRKDRPGGSSPSHR